MKKIKHLIFLIPVVLSMEIQAQKNVDIKENVVLMSLGDRTGYSVILSGESEKDVTKALKEWLNDTQKKITLEEMGKHEIKADNIKIVALSENPSDIYFLLTESKDEVLVTGFFEVNGTFVSSSTNEGKVKDCEALMTNFVYRIERLSLEEKVVVAQKSLGKTNDEQIELQKKNKQLNDQIEEWNKSIEKAKSDLQQNGKDQENKKSEISTSEQILKDLENDLDKYKNY